MITYDSNIFGSNREFDRNGFLKVEANNITKTQVAPYLGKEIPNWKGFNLEPDKIYYVLRPEEELKKAAKTFNNLPLTRKHIEVDVDNVPKEDIIGSMGDKAEYTSPYITNSLIVYDKKEIDKILSGKKKELSCGYTYTPIPESGEFEGKHYDFKMTDIVGNHVALVKEGRAGHDVMVADEKPDIVIDGGEGSGNFGHIGRIGEVGGSSGSVNLSRIFVDLIESGKAITERKIEERLNEIIGMPLDTKTPPLQIRVTEENKNHIKHTNIKLKGAQIYRHNAALYEIKRIIENAKKIDMDGGVDFSHNTRKETIEHKERVLEYVYFSSPAVIKSKEGEPINFDVILSAERVKGQDENLLDLYHMRVKKSSATVSDDALSAEDSTKSNFMSNDVKPSGVNYIIAKNCSDVNTYFTESHENDKIEQKENDIIVEDEEIPEKQDEPEKAGEEVALNQGETKMADKVKEALAEEKVEEVKEEKLADDACGKAKDKKEAKDACDEKEDKKKLADKKEEDLKGKEKEAFAEGVEYGEEKEKAEPKKLDSEHESEGMKKEEKEMAKDSAMAMDVDAIKAEAREEGRKEAMEDYKAREVARKAVRKMVGDVDVFAFDSAEEIYKFACEKSGLDLTDVACYKDVFRGLSARKGGLAMDASPVSGSNEECLRDIRISY